MEAKRGCKIRKRGCSSSSSSSLARNKNRFKRAILAGKRAVVGGGGWSGTPVKPTPVRKSPGFNMVSPEKLQMDHQIQSSSVSARKLAAMVWEIDNGIRPPGNLNGDCLGVKQTARNREKAVVSSSQNFPPNLSDPISALRSERKGRSTGELIRRTSKIYQKSKTIDDKISGGTDSMESRRREKCSVRLKDFGDSLTTSKEIVKALTRVGGVSDHQDRQMPGAGKMLISALRCELDHLRSILNRLMKEHRKTNKKEIIIQRLMEEKPELMKKREMEKERERMMRLAVSREIGVERKLRKQTERVNKKLGRELENAKVMLSKAKEELESEKRAKEILEEVCEELVRGVGEDKAEIEKIRREAEKVKEEVEKEREMMQIANILREERVQMKLSEAKYEFEEKNAEVEKMRSELKDYLKKDYCDISDRDSDDLESIELNMDSTNKVYKWSYAESRKFSGKNCRKVHQKDSNDDSAERRSLVIDFQTANPNSEDIQEHIEGGSVGKRSVIREDQQEEEIDREKCIKNLRNFILSNMRFASPSKQ